MAKYKVGDKETYHELIERIELLEIQVAENSRILDEYLSKQSQPNPEYMYEWKDGRLRLIPEPSKKSANELRKEAIEKAKKFVEDTEKMALNNPEQVGNYELRTFRTRVEYVINEDKRTVVALGRGVSSGKIRVKGIAKCAPDDVFNADIGKAIAVGRAFGLDTEEFEKAPQPDEVVAGMVVKNEGLAGGTYVITGVDGFKLFIRHSGEGPHFTKSYATIISDTEAKYE